VSYRIDSYSFSVNHSVSRTEYHSNNTRQRKRYENRNDIFSVSLMLNDEDLNEFEFDFQIKHDYGGNTFQAQYWVSDVPKTGTALLVSGSYQATLLADDIWNLSYTLEIIDRDMTDQQNVYEVVSTYTDFDAFASVINATSGLNSTLAENFS